MHLPTSAICARKVWYGFQSSTQLGSIHNSHIQCIRKDEKNCIKRFKFTWLLNYFSMLYWSSVGLDNALWIFLHVCVSCNIYTIVMHNKQFQSINQIWDLHTSKRHIWLIRRFYLQESLIVLTCSCHNCTNSSVATSPLPPGLTPVTSNDIDNISTLPHF